MSKAPGDEVKESGSPEAEIVLEVEDLHVSFGDRAILQGITLRLHRGETVVIMGGSGCGKSTLLRSIIGAVELDSGDVRVLGSRFSELRGDALLQHRTRLGILFQSGALFHSMTVGENISMVLREHTPLDEEEIRMLVKMKLEMVGLRHAEDLLPDEISGGMKKRVALARALALDPEIMLYDEPGGGLDPVSLAGVDKLISTLGRARSIGSLVVTHRISSGLGIADRVIFLHQGRVLAEGSPEEITEHPDERVQQFLNGRADGPMGHDASSDGFATSLLGEAIAS